MASSASTSVKPLTILSEDDGVPGSKIEQDPRHYTVDQLKRWLKCRGLKQSGKREGIVQRVASCLQGPNHRVLDVSIDGGKWFAAKVLKENEELKGILLMNKLLFPLYQRKDGAVFHHKIYHRCSTMNIFITMLLSPSKLCSWTPPPPPPPPQSR